MHYKQQCLHDVPKQLNQLLVTEGADLEGGTLPFRLSANDNRNRNNDQPINTSPASLTMVKFVLTPCR